MPIALVISLITQVGLPLAMELLKIWESGKTSVTSADLQALIDLGKYTSSDSLAKADISIQDGKVVPVPPV